MENKISEKPEQTRGMGAPMSISESVFACKEKLAKNFKGAEVMEMTDRDKLWYLINGVFDGRYDVAAFCSEFTNIYNLDMDYSQLSKQEKQEFEDLCSMAERFSADEQELKIPNMYYSEADILEKVKKLMLNLKCMK